MKITHFTHKYHDGWGFQDNLLPRYQQKAGDEVALISDIDHLNPTLRSTVLPKGREYWDDDLRIIRIRCYLNTKQTSLLCRGFYKRLKQEAPDLIFHHVVNSSTMVVAAFYKMFHPNTVLFVDNHADAINMTKNKVWHYCFEKGWLSFVCWLLRPLIDKYYGVTKLRCDYLHDVFHIPNSKIGLLPLGGDTDAVDAITESKEELRIKYNIPTNDFVIASGGKLDKTKGIPELIDAYHAFKKDHPNTSLVLFGRMDEVVQNEVNKYDDITVFGWCDRRTTLSLLKMADVGVWPLLHTTLIEDAVSCGTPIIVKMSDNVSHLASDGVGVFLKRGDSDELHASLKEIHANDYSYRANAAKDKYSYHTIANQVKEDYLKCHACK